MTFKVAYLTTKYDPSLVYGVETTIGTLTNTRLSCVHTSHPKMFTPRLEAVDFAVFVMTMTMYQSHLSVSQLSRLEVDTNQQLANRNDPYFSPSAVMMVSSGLAAAVRVPRLILSRCDVRRQTTDLLDPTLWTGFMETLDNISAPIICFSRGEVA